ncbi:DUF3119 family protein [Merismopedia glauca]|uniref:DUF3119 domain-containing protein n=1 Tax=Merismopedia glauca CCAP 1448/3 TaxID=1296344 RepID=A0A2T1BWM2_9CYAN|nr:DUF3119 family protein [Merismopedia glauca]PSB00419.1 DUF3119 domain-containing protein [Merismopedia glauca CCAP 1448/3]
MNNTPSLTTSTQDIELKPSYALPLALIIGSIGLIPIQLLLAALISIFGLFLMVQTALIRLKFTEKSLEVYRSQKLIRDFPYEDWLNWEIFWQPLPILFYFKEVKSIHFLPILFDAKMLQTCLEERCPKKLS